MESADGDSIASLTSCVTTPIAQLSPDLPDQTARAVRGEVTITWPYSAVSKTFAFLLAEPDVRLRRAKGQVRIELCGPSAKAAAECGLGAGDELLFSLDGAEWSRDPSPGRIPGARVDWQLRFGQKLFLQVRSGETGDTKLINIDHPASELPDGPVADVPRRVTPDPEPDVASQSPVRKISDVPLTEYPSPAFVKRARLSYGALFEGGLDIFEEDGGIRGKGRKRTRFARDGSTWRYSSQSPSPEPTSPARDAMDEDAPQDAIPQSSPTPQMMDEGCQTVEVETTSAALGPSDAAATHRETAPVSQAPSEGTAALAPGEPDASQQIKQVPVPPAPEETPSSFVKQNEQSELSGAEPNGPSQARQVEGARRVFEQESKVDEGADGEHHAINFQESSTPESRNTGTGATVLFASGSLDSSFSSHGAPTPRRVESSLGLADQVRFGFAHAPQPALFLSPSGFNPVSGPDNDKHEPYPASYLDHVGAPAKYADMDTYVDAGGEPPESTVHGQESPSRPPTVERFGHDQWEMSTQSPHFNQVEGGHFGADALAEGVRITAGQSRIHADEIPADKVPEGFASYGGEDAFPTPQEALSEKGATTGKEPFAEKDTISAEEVGVEEDDDDDDDDEDAKSDAYAYGDRIEEGDYDQRNYDVPSDDDEGLSDEDDEMELEAEERYGNGEVYDEDGEGEEWDEEDEEDYGSEEEDYEDEEDSDLGHLQPRKPPGPAPTGEPVVISLLSDSEDENEDEQASPPRKLPAAPAVPELPRGSSGGTSLAHQPSPAVPAIPELPADTGDSASLERQPFPTALTAAGSADADSAVKEHPPRNIFSQTHVIDFGALSGPSSAGGPAGKPIAGTNTDADVLLSIEQPPGPTNSDRPTDKSDTPAIRQAPTEDSLGGLFVPQTKAETSPSESSSDGLFISQPRARYREVVDKHAVDESGKWPAGVDGEPTARGKDLKAENNEQGNHEERHIAIEKVDHSEARSPRPYAGPSEQQGPRLSLPDTDDVSFDSQVETNENDIRSESEDESISSQDVPVKNPATGRTAMEPEGIAPARDEDVHMADADAANIELAAAGEKALESARGETSDATAAVGSRHVVTEVVSEGSLVVPDIPVSDEPVTTQDAPRIIQDAADGGQVVGGGPQEQSRDDPDVLPEISPSVAQNQAETVQPNSQGVPETGSMALEVEGQAHEPSAQAPVDSGVVPPAEKQLEAGGDFLTSSGIADDMPGVSTSQSPRSAQAPKAGDVPDSGVLAQPPTVAGLTEDPLSSDHERSPLLAELDEREPAVDGEAEQAALQPQEEQNAAHHPPTPTPEVDVEDETLILQQLTQEQEQSLEAAAAEARDRSRSPSPDLSVHLARQAVAARRQKKAPQPVRTSPRLTRARSSSLRSNTTPEREEDNSVSLARAALASPSRRGVEAGAAPAAAAPASAPSTSPVPSPSPAAAAAALESELAKRLRTELPACVPLRSLRAHVDKFPDAVVAVATSQPSTPARAKGGPREYLMSFRVTDPSAAPRLVVEVQMYRPHKESLPVVHPGDAVLLQRFQVKAFSGKGFGLRTGSESAWAVWDGAAAANAGGGGNQGNGCGPPQIRGPPVEDWESYAGYVGALREWYRLLCADPMARGKLEAADRKLAEAGKAKK